MNLYPINMACCFENAGGSVVLEYHSVGRFPTYSQFRTAAASCRSGTMVCIGGEYVSAFVWQCFIYREHRGLRAESGSGTAVSLKHDEFLRMIWRDKFVQYFIAARVAKRLVKKHSQSNGNHRGSC